MIDLVHIPHSNLSSFNAARLCLLKFLSESKMPIERPGRTLLKIQVLESMIKGWKAELEAQQSALKGMPTQSASTSFAKTPDMASTQAQPSPALRRPPVVQERKLPPPSYADQARMGSALTAIYNAVLSVANEPCAAPFRFSVFEMYDPASLVGYDKIVRTPMDFSQVLNGIVRMHYAGIDDVLKDVALIFENCERFNGPRHQFVAVNIPDCRQRLEIVRAQFTPQESVTQPQQVPISIDQVRDTLKQSIEALMEQDEDSLPGLIEFMEEAAPALVNEIDGEYELELENPNVTRTQLEKVLAYVQDLLAK